MSITSMEMENLVPKRPRIRYTKLQIEVLERHFEEDQYPDSVEQEVIAMNLKVSLERIATWFQNRRSKYRRECKTEHMAWMRKQVFLGSEGRYGQTPSNDRYGQTSPNLPVLTPCHVLSPLERNIRRNDDVNSPQACFSGLLQPVIMDQTTTIPRAIHHINQTPSRQVRHAPYNMYRGNNVHRASPYDSLSPSQESKHTNFLLPDQWCPPLWSSNVPSLHNIASNHTTRTPFSDVITNTQPRCDDPIKLLEESDQPQTPSSVDNQPSSTDYSETKTPSPSFSCFDSDSDDSPTKDRTLKLLSKWC